MIGLSEKTPTVSSPPTTSRYPLSTTNSDAFSEPAKSILIVPCPMFFINRFDGFIGGAVSPNLECKSSQSSGRPSSYPRAQIPTPFRLLNKAKSYFNDRDRLSSYHP